MKRIIVVGLMMLVFAAGLAGCATQPSHRPSPPVRSDLVYLDTWLEQDVLNKVAEELQTSSFMKSLPFVIVKARGEVVSNRIDPLTENVRERLVSVFLGHAGINLVRRHPAPVIERTYKLQDLKCGRYIEHQMLLTIDIRQLGKPEDRTARVNIRAIDRKKDSWVKGFSIYKDVWLSPRQSDDLNTPSHPDEYLRGLKYVPFLLTQADEMGAYLASNLSCMFKEGHGGKDIRLFVDDSKLRRKKQRNIAWFVKNQLNFCNEIRVVDSKPEADWTLTVETREIDAAKGLSQLWITVPGEKGVATYVYFTDKKTGQSPLSGMWKVKDLGSGETVGFLEMSGEGVGRYRGNFFESDGRTPLKLGIIINVRKKDINWTYYDESKEKTFEIEGAITDEGERIAATVTSFPSSGDMNWEFVFVE